MIYGQVFLAVAREVYSLWPCDPHHFLRSAGNLSLVLHLVEKNHDSVWLVVLTCFNHLEKCESQCEGWHPIYEMENNPNVWNHEPAVIWAEEDLDPTFRVEDCRKTVENMEHHGRENMQWDDRSMDNAYHHVGLDRSMFLYLDTPPSTRFG